MSIKVITINFDWLKKILFKPPLFLPAVYLLPANEGFYNFYVWHLCQRNLHNVGIEYHKIGYFARFKAAFSVFFKSGSSSPDRHATQCFFPRKRIFTLKSSFRESVSILPGSGRKECKHGIDFLNGKIRSSGIHPDSLSNCL